MNSFCLLLSSSWNVIWEFIFKYMETAICIFLVFILFAIKRRLDTANIFNKYFTVFEFNWVSLWMKEIHHKAANITKRGEKSIKTDIWFCFALQKLFKSIVIHWYIDHFTNWMKIVDFICCTDWIFVKFHSITNWNLIFQEFYIGNLFNHSMKWDVTMNCIHVIE